MFTLENYKEWLKLSYFHKYHYEGWELLWKETPTPLEKQDQRIRELNKLMIEQYPFLLPRNRWTDKVSEDYNYDYNEWEAIPLGWQIAFGWKLLNELNNLLIKHNIVDKFRITQIKEKFGELRLYCTSNKEILELISKYTYESQTTCIICGDKADYISRGWICPYCEQHVPDKNNADSLYELDDKGDIDE